jgi:enoyl-CoA hydratase/carnithine racemase
MSEILFTASGSTATVRLNRPEKRNALSSGMISMLGEVFARIHDDKSIRAVILTGDERCFCSGTEVAVEALCNQIESFRCPVIAAVNGVAAGGGLELMLACHLRVVASDCEFSLPDKKLSAEAARRLGLVNKVVDPQSVLTEAESYAKEISELAPLAIGAVIQAVVKGMEVSLDQGLELENKLFAELFSGAEVREGTRAFLEKRKPSF